MCGIAGIISLDPQVIDTPILQKMAACLSHRGPDGQATWISPDGRTGFAHSRLKVIDLSDSAAQPMHFGSRYTIVYNGELYNYRELRSDLITAGISFISNSDTEVVLAAYAYYGDDCLKLFDGMLAFAIWDQKEQRLFCARDRFGEKPFYYYIDPAATRLYFASEMKGIYAAGIVSTVDHGMLLGYLGLGQTSDPLNAGRTFDAAIKRLAPAHYMLVSTGDASISVIQKRYWDLEPVSININLNQAAERLEELLTLSVSRRLRSDVDTGMSLSGGLDSSCIAATIRSLSDLPFSAFTAVFEDFEANEERAASAIASQFHINHYRVTMSATDLVSDLERLVIHQEEPFTSASVYAQFKVFEAAKSAGTTVLLDGQGADEVLAGYTKYLRWRQYSLFPGLIARALELKPRLTLVNHPFIDREFGREYHSSVGIHKPRVKSLNNLLYYNTCINGLDELLRYADRNAMAHGREVRMPFLFHELVEFAFGLPTGYKIGDGQTKLVLRKAFNRRLPEQTVNNKRKIGFEPPQKKWMNDDAVIQLWQASKETLYKHGVLNKKGRDKVLTAHGSYDAKSFDWRVLVAGIWMMVINKKGV